MHLCDSVQHPRARTSLYGNKSLPSRRSWRSRKRNSTRWSKHGRPSVQSVKKKRELTPVICILKLKTFSWDRTRVSAQLPLAVQHKSFRGEIWGRHCYKQDSYRILAMPHNMATAVVSHRRRWQCLHLWNHSSSAPLCDRCCNRLQGGLCTFSRIIGINWGMNCGSSCYDVFVTTVRMSG